MGSYAAQTGSAAARYEHSELQQQQYYDQQQREATVSARYPVSSRTDVSAGGDRSGASGGDWSRPSSSAGSRSAAAPLLVPAGGTPAAEFGEAEGNSGSMATRVQAVLAGVDTSRTSRLSGQSGARAASAGQASQPTSGRTSIASSSGTTITSAPASRLPAIGPSRSALGSPSSHGGSSVRSRRGPTPPSAGHGGQSAPAPASVPQLSSAVAPSSYDQQQQQHTASDEQSFSYAQQAMRQEQQELDQEMQRVQALRDRLALQGGGRVASPAATAAAAHREAASNATGGLSFGATIQGGRMQATPAVSSRSAAGGAGGLAASRYGAGATVTTSMPRDQAMRTPSRKTTPPQQPAAPIGDEGGADGEVLIEADIEISPQGGGGGAGKDAMSSVDMSSLFFSPATPLVRGRL